ncbi:MULTISPECIES: O-antigen ligase [Butyricimonas]|jgi:membrane protein|uniref:O-antigen ligase family protein n=1 Tax=Butyricimonas hominis TaxID=2763032 RepID=A0ABR7D5F6_9BACT|nr:MULTISPECIES: O-antigen ligase family protein [Butyricimonas]MBC5622720.1 O-antigen ligase family protein [Butyricimonas hominis]
MKIDNFLLLLFSFFLGLGGVSFWGSASSEGGSVFTQLFLLLFICVAFFSKRNRLHTFSYGNYIFALLGVWLITFLSSIFHQINLFDVFYLVYFLKYALAMLTFVILLIYFERDEKLLFKSLFCFSFASGLVALVFLLNLLPGAFDFHNGRLAIVGENANTTGGRFALSFIVLSSFIIFDVFKWRVKRLVLIFFALPIFFMVVASGSRGAFLAMIIVTMIMYWYSIASWKKRILVFSPVLLISVLFVIYWMGTKEEFVMAERLLDVVKYGSNGGRDMLMVQAMDIFSDYPLFGCGEPLYVLERSIRFNEHLPVHNLLIHTLVTGGVVALLCLVAFYVLLFKDSVEVLQKTPLPMCLFLYILMLAMKSGGFATFLSMWYIFSIVAALSRLIKKNESMSL